MSNRTTFVVASNTVYQVIGKVLTMSVTVLATLLVTRIYGREAYGEFSLMQNWPAILYIIADFGFNAIATRDLSRDFSKTGRYLGNIFVIRTLMSVFFIALLWGSLVFFPYSAFLKLGIRLTLFLILTQSLFTTANIVFQTKLKYNYSTVSLILGYVVILGLILFFAYLKLPVLWISITYVIGGIITFLTSCYYLKKLGIHIELKPDRTTAKYLVIQTLPLGFMFIFSQINFKVDELLLSVLHLPTGLGLNNTESVAIYALPYKIFEVSLVVPTFFMNSVYPIMVRHMVEGRDKIKATFTKTVYFLASCAILAGILGFFFAPFMIKIVGGPEFTRSVPVLRILLGGLIFYSLTQPLSWLLVTLNKQKYLPFIYLTAAVFNLWANLTFIPKYSFYGAAVITHISELLILVMLIVFTGKAWKDQYAAEKVLIPEVAVTAD